MLLVVYAQITEITKIAVKNEKFSILTGVSCWYTLFFFFFVKWLMFSSSKKSDLGCLFFHETIFVHAVIFLLHTIWNNNFTGRSFRGRITGITQWSTKYILRLKLFSPFVCSMYTPMLWIINTFRVRMFTSYVDTYVLPAIHIGWTLLP